MSERGGRSSRFVSQEVPLYYQLGTLLREQILHGEYAPGDQLPTETQLVADYGVSRITVRQALKVLEEERLIRREAGRGTFVTDDAPAPRTLRMNGSLDDLMTMGLATSVSLLDLRRVAATPDDARLLAVDAATELVQCTRLRLFHGQPYSYIINRIPAEIAEKLGDHDWETGSILTALETRLGLRLRDADQVMRATLADVNLARLLETRIGAPLLMVDRVVRTDEGCPVERVHTYYRGDLYSLNVHLTRDPEAGRSPSQWTLKKSSERE